MKDNITKLFTSIGFFSLLLCAFFYVGLVIWGVWAGLLDSEVPWFAKGLIGFGILGGGILLLVVLRERFIESKTDKYKDVEV